MELFDHSRHEPLRGMPWDEAVARRAIEAIVHDCADRFSPDRLWPLHALDLEGRPPTEPFTMFYLGAAGVIWALDFLVRRGLAPPTKGIANVLDGLEERNRSQVGSSESFFIGRSGVLLTHFRVAPSREIADALEQSIAANTEHPSCELLWGAPGTMHAALAMHEWTGETRWAELYRSGARSLARSLSRHDKCELWTQALWGRRFTQLGAAHGFAGNAGAILRGIALLPKAERAAWTERITRTAQASAIRDGPFANWPVEYPSHPRSDTKILVQWCHGAPGFVTSLAELADPRLDEILLGAGELIWAAGPLAKGAGLCHGTAGNGYAFLKLYRRTRDRRWLERARAFAMHAISQSELDAATYGMRRYSLYTGDPGLAIYLARCIDGAAAWPGLDPER